MKTWVVLATLVAGCWGGTPKEQTTMDPNASELATARGEVQVLERRNHELATELADAQDRARVLEVQVKTLEAAAATVAAATPPPPPRPPRREPDRAKTYAISIANAPVEGPADAKVTMVVAGEYGCPYCEKVRPTLVELHKKYGKELRIVFRQFIVHPRIATAAAYASCAANRQRKFAAMDTLLWDKGFKNRQFDTETTLPDGTTQACWTTADGCPIVLGFAKEAGLNLTRFKSDMQACEAEVTDGVRDLASFGVGATPSFFINGRYTSGAQPIESFSTLIDEEAAKADERIKQGTKRAKYYQQYVLDVGEKSLGTP
jgi:protein-disulfide isomerase